MAGFRSILLEDILWLAEGAKHPVHPDGVVAVVVPVRRVVDGVVASAHHRPDLAVDAVMNVARPDDFQEHEGRVGPEVCRDEKKSKHVRYGL